MADKVGIPQLSRLADLPLPRPSIPLSMLIKAYQNHATSSDGTKRKVETTWTELTETTGATTLRELSTERLVSYADAIRKRLPSPDSVATIFQRIKTVIGFGLKRGGYSDRVHCEVIQHRRDARESCPGHPCGSRGFFITA